MVIQMVLSKSVTRHKEPMISLYMPLLVGHLPTSMLDSLEDVKCAVVEKGGKRNASCRFLRRGCQDSICASNNYLVCKGVQQIPRTADLPKYILPRLDSGRM